MDKQQFENFIDGALKRVTQAPAADDAAAARVMARLTELPRQRVSLWRLPSVLLDLEFAPAWPRMAALAGCLALGFIIGIASVDRLDGAALSRGDNGLIVFEPEPLIGARP